MDNKLTENAGWDEELLRLELAALQEQDYDLDLIGFEADELAELMAEDSAALTDEDQIPTAPSLPVTVAGESESVCRLGQRRVAERFGA